MNIEIHLEDECLDLLIVRKHVSKCNHLLKAAAYIFSACGCETCTLYSIQRPYLDIFKAPGSPCYELTSSDNSTSMRI